MQNNHEMVQTTSAHTEGRADLDTTSLKLAAVAAILMSATTGAMAWFWRLQIGDECSLLIVSLVALAGGFIFLPLWARSARLPADLTASSAAALPLSIVALVCLAGRFAAASIVLDLLLIASWIVGARTLISKAPSLKQCLLASLIGASLGLVNFFVINRLGTSTIFSPEAALVGNGHLDMLFHAAIAAMFSNSGFLTTGLDGYVLVNYHAFSHLFFGYLSQWINVSTVKIYAVVMMVFGAPLLLFGTAFAIHTLWRPAAGARSPLNLLLVPLAVFSIFETGDWISYLASESYLLALVFFLLAFPLLLMLAEAETLRAAYKSCITALIVAPVLVFTKVSVGFVFIAAVLTLVCLRTFKRPLFWRLASSAFVLAAIFLVWLGTSPEFWKETTFAFGQFVTTYPYVAALNMGVTAAGIAFLVSRRRDRDDRTRVMLAFASIASIYPAVALNINGGSQYYFVNIGAWISLLSLTGFVILPMLERVRSYAPGVVAGAIIIVATVISPAKRDSVGKFFRDIEDMTNAVHPASEKLKVESFSAARDALRRLSKDLNETYAAHVLNAIAGHLGPDRAHVAVYIPPAIFQQWTLQNECRAKGFVIPAFLSIPMVLGLPSDCTNLLDYGFSAYGDGSKNREANDDELCNLGQRAHFGRILKVESKTVVRDVRCDLNINAARKPNP